jgi:hypothetical protein
VREEAVRRVLMVRAIEEADRDGQLLTPQERVQATVVTPGMTGRDRPAAIEQRAGRLIEILLARASWVGTVLNATRIPAAAAWVLPVLAGAVGLLTDALGPERRINILSVPLLGLIVWNLGIYFVLAISWLARALRRRAAQHGGAIGTPGGWAAVLAAWTDWRARRRVGARAEGARLAGQVVSAYLTRWRRLAAPLLEARIRLLLHLGAALLAVGVLGGAYWRGIAFEYQATWESTFLGPGGLRAVLVTLLGPASLLLGEPIPSAAALASLRAPAVGEAAPWVHLYALTTLLLVIVPRMLLAAASFVRARHLAANLPIDLGEPYFTRLIPGTRPLAHVDVLPYGMKLASPGTETLRGLLRDLVGASAEVRIERDASYGDEPDAVLSASAAGTPAGDGGLECWRTLVFSLAQSPEDEVHGELLTRLAGWVAGGARGSRRALVVVDASSYRRRLGGTGTEAQRVADRQRAWDQVARRAGTTLAHLDLDGRVPDDEALAQLQRAVWPPPARG